MNNEININVMPMQLEQGDLLLVQFPDNCCYEDVERLHQAIKRLKLDPNIKILVVPESIGIRILRSKININNYNSKQKRSKVFRKSADRNKVRRQTALAKP